MTDYTNKFLKTKLVEIVSFYVYLVKKNNKFYFVCKQLSVCVWEREKLIKKLTVFHIKIYLSAAETKTVKKGKKSGERIIKIKFSCSAFPSFLLCLPWIVVFRGKHKTKSKGNELFKYETWYEFILDAQQEADCQKKYTLIMLV